MTFLDIQEAFASKISFSKNIESLINEYLELLIKANEKTNLTALSSYEEMMVKHVYDCLLPVSNTLLDDKKVADVGTGAGFPGLLWAIVFPKAEVTLIEATHKKCDFLQSVKEKLSLKNVEIINARAEELSDFRESFDLVSARAVASLSILLELCTPLVRVGGYFLAMKGAKGEEELLNAKHASQVLSMQLAKKQVDSLPFESGERINLFFKKEKETAPKYPRVWAKIIAKPL